MNISDTYDKLNIHIHDSMDNSLNEIFVDHDRLNAFVINLIREFSLESLLALIEMAQYREFCVY